ncbi:unnamed protein product [Brachionus calyciflorus]|uniref:Prion-like-(Q N-rich) domain-bearing 25 n=1 Tax=Brachionus calyciflorus TaxID=104777 RepID=A0A814M932_9BILA|nr:unnamed protein product [Brachionus calyciflorus]
MSTEKPFDDTKSQVLRKTEIWSADDDQGKEFLESTSTKQKINPKQFNPKQQHYIVNQYKVKPDLFKSLINSLKFKIPMWVIAIFAALALLALLGGLAALLVALLSPRKYVSYNQKCDNSTTLCDPSKNLYCTNGLCTCVNSNYYWSNSTSDCEYRKSYAESCSSTNECFESYGLYCSKTPSGCNCPTTSVANMCDCTSTKYFDENTKGCVTKLSFGSSCTFNTQCLQTISLVCSSAGTCACPTTHYFKNSKCNLKGTLGSSCSSSFECDESKGLTRCDSTTSFKCQCMLGFYFESSVGQCNLAKTYGSSCASSSYCDSTKKLTCTSAKCSCQSSFPNWSYTDNTCKTT